MHKLYENVEKELKNIEQTGINSNNLDTTFKLASIGKNLKKMEKYEKEVERMRDYYTGSYDRPYRDSYDTYGHDHHRGGDYVAYIEGEYGRRGPRMRYMDHGHEHDRFYEHMDKMEDGLDMYTYGRRRYRDSGDNTRMHEGLEKMMYGVCMFIESALDFAETPEEKEIIRKHIQKLKTK